MEYIVLLTLMGITTLPIKGGTLDNCPPADPNCHPSCIVYTADHCRYCMCDQESARGTSSSGFGSGSGTSSDAAWDRGFEEGDWSSKMNTDTGAWTNTGGGGFSSAGFGSSSRYSSDDREETVKYVIVEKEPEPRRSNSQYPSGIRPLSVLPNPFPSGMSSPFAGSHIPSAVLPGTNTISDSHSYGANVIYVPLLAPGIPKYCVRCRIPSCPETCERIDEYGCRSCPCAPSRYQTMPVIKDCSKSEIVVKKPDCSATKLCMETCSDGYQLGDVGGDGCRSCTCIRRVPTTPAPTTPKPVASCPATLSCMLKCKDGYLLGEKQANGCPACKCLAKGHDQNSASNSNNYFNSNNNKNVNNNNNNNNNKFNSNNYSNNKWGDGASKWSNNNAQSMNSGNTGNGNGGSGNGCSGTKSNYLSSRNGIGSGKCEPPMCFDGHMSVDQAMKIGSESAGGGGGCNEGGGSGVTDGGSMSGPSNSFPMNSGGFGNGMGGSGIGSGSVGSGGMGMGGMGTGGASASGSGMPSPFSVSMSGSGPGGMTSGGGGKGAEGGMPFSPFSSAMSGAGSGKGIGGSTRAGMGGVGVMGSAIENAVSAAAYNKDCVGAECSAKNRIQHRDCPDLVHCLITCDGSYMLGQLDDAGCQTCSCTT